MRNTTRLKDLISRRQALTVPGSPNALFARVVEDLGFSAVYVTGAGIANMHLGAPDIGLTTLTEVASTVAAISGVDVRRDGEPIAPMLWGTAVPVDPGVHAIAVCRD